MTHSLKLAGLASLFLFLGSCSSDDSTPAPPQGDNNQYFISKIDYVVYDTTTISNGSSTTTESSPVFDRTVHFFYDKTYQLDSITRDSKYFSNGIFVANFHHVYTHKLDALNRLERLDIESKQQAGKTTYTFTYEQDLLMRFSILRGSEIALTYNSKKQFTQGKVLLATDQPNSIEPHTIQYAYGHNNQLTQLLYQKDRANFTYDESKNPFGHLPYDFTTLLFDPLTYIPLTYSFENNITMMRFTGSSLANYSIEYSYNKGNYPEKATVYKGAKTKANRYMVINYNYHIVPKN